MSTASYVVEGMHCDHCVHAVSTEIQSLPGVRSVVVTLGEPSRVEVSSDAPLDRAAVAAAVVEAGYVLQERS